MKKLLKAVTVVGVLLLFAMVDAHATGEDGYHIRTKENGYTLYAVYDGSESPVMSGDSLVTVFDALSQIGEGVIWLDGIAIDEAVELSGDFAVRGICYVYSGGMLNIVGGSVAIDGADMSFSGGGIRLKNGVLTLDGGMITASGTLLYIDRAAAASFEMNGGSIIGASGEPLIMNKTGTVTLYSGKIINEYGSAISNEASLIIAGDARVEGAEHAIASTRPLYLSDGKGELSERITVKFGFPIRSGALTPLFYNATERSLSGITVYDALGRSYPIEYFEEHYSVDERAFGAVYLPYTVSYYSDGILVRTQSCLEGECAEYTAGAVRSGYSFSHWSADGIGGAPYDFKTEVKESLDLHANYKLDAPSFSLSSREFDYSGETYIIEPDKIYHPLLSEAGLAYEWYKDGAPVSSAPFIKLRDVSDSGEYRLKLTLTHRSDSVSVTTPAADLIINRKMLPIPTVEPEYYSGRPIHPSLYSGSLYEVEDISAVNAGQYRVPLRLTDAENYVFENGEAEAYAVFTVLPADNYWLEEPRAYDCYAGGTPTLAASSRFGEVGFVFSSSAEGPYSEEMPRLTGEYYCIARVPECENYSALSSEPMSFKILSEIPVGLIARELPLRTEYFSFDKLDTAGLEIEAHFNSGRTESVPADKLIISYPSADSLRVRDTYVTVSYLGVSIPISVRVSPREYDLSDIKFEDASVIYDGERKSIGYRGELPVGLDGIPLTAEVIGGGVNVGAYTVVLSFGTESGEYRMPNAVEATLYVLPFEAAVVFEETEFVYDGEVKRPRAFIQGVFGERVELFVVGARSLAGEYTAVAEISDPNYKLIGASVRYKILKADYDLSSAVWSDTVFVYDGRERCVTVSGLPDGVGVIGYVDNKATLAGVYRAKASLSYDENNYNPPHLPEFEWRIEKGSYDLSGLSFSDAEYIYDGEEHFPAVIGELPVGADGSVLEYRFSRGAVNVSDGRLEVVISFLTESRNYEVPSPRTAYATVLPRGISVEWKKPVFVYNTSYQVPVAIADECPVSVSGGGIDAGEYTAAATSLDPNYYVVNSECLFVIQRADNYWRAELRISDIFEGEALSPVAEALGGTVRFRYYNADMAEIDPPTESGKYYAAAFTEGDGNYKPLESEPLSFEIIEIVPIGIDVMLLNGSFKAFEKLSEADVSVFVNMNDGSRSSVEHELLLVDYGGADSFRFGDTSVRVSYLGFSVTSAVTVERAEYDLGGVFWSEGDFSFDGSPKQIFLSGLPEGVEIVSYDGNGAVDSGEYTVNAIPLYDTHNYKEPMLPQGHYVIRKQRIPLPVIPPLIYNGREQSPLFEETSIYRTEESFGIDAGDYFAMLRIKDPKNYEFEGGGEAARVPFVIEPREVRIKISDVERYWFERPSEASFEVILGEICEGDTLDVEYWLCDGAVRARVSSPNYAVETVDGVYTEHSAFSERGLFWFFLINLSLLTLALLLTVLFLRRRQIVNFVSIIKCRFSRVASAPPEDTGVVLAEKDGIDGEIMSIDLSRADALITDSLAKDLIRNDKIEIETDGTKKHVVNIDTLSESFDAGERVDVNRLKEMSLVPYDTAYLKVLARGMIDKPLRVYANDFSLTAVKMIALTGGEAIRVVTVKKQKNKKRGRRRV